MELRKRTIFLSIFSGHIPLHSPYIVLIYGRYLQFRILKFPLTYTINIFFWGIFPYIHLTYTLHRSCIWQAPFDKSLPVDIWISVVPADMACPISPIPKKPSPAEGFTCRSTLGKRVSPWRCEGCDRGTQQGNFSTFCDLTYGTVLIVNDSLGDYTTQFFGDYHILFKKHKECSQKSRIT